MEQNAIEVCGVRKHFGVTRAVDGVDLAVREGELFGLIGHNGAGKTTLFKLMLGLLPETAGEIRIKGEPVRGAGFRDVRRGIGYLPESLALYDNLTGLETLQLFARLKGAPVAECPALLEKVGLAPAGSRAVRTYSKGMKQRLGFAQALLGKPRILFLDEPTNGLDPEGIQEFYAILRELRDEGVTMILTSHILAEIQQRVDRLALMNSGRLQALGTVQSLREGLDLPLSMEVEFAPEAREAVGEALSALGLGPVDFTRHTAAFLCPRHGKLAVLAALSRNGQVADIHIKEPSLEDVFLGYREAA